MQDELAALRHAVLVASLVPEDLPERIAAAAVEAVADASGPSAAEFAGWGVEPAESAQAGRVARLAIQARDGRVDSQLQRRVGSEFGEDGLVAVFGIAAAVRMFDGVRRPLARPGTDSLSRAIQDDSNRETFIQIRKSFGLVPAPWRVVGRQPALLSRWWSLHEALLAPASLTGDEKRLAAVGAARAYGLGGLADVYLPQLSAWSAEQVEGAVTSESLRVRRGVRSALPAIKAYATGGLDSDRFELAAAAMSSEESDVLRAIVGFFSGMAVFALLS